MASELDFRGSLDGGFLGLVEIEEVLRTEAQGASKQCRRKALPRGVVFRGSVVEEAARGRQFVLEVSELGLKLLVVGVGFGVRVGFRQGNELPDAGGELAFGGGLRGGPGSRCCSVALLDHVLQRIALVFGIAFHRLDQIRHKVMALLQLHVDVGERLFAALAQRDQPVVASDQPQRSKPDNPEYDPECCCHVLISCCG
jgi:hypothetical protein